MITINRMYNTVVVSLLTTTTLIVTAATLIASIMTLYALVNTQELPRSEITESEITNAPTDTIFRKTQPVNVRIHFRQSKNLMQIIASDIALHGGQITGTRTGVPLIGPFTLTANINEEYVARLTALHDAEQAHANPHYIDWITNRGQIETKAQHTNEFTTSVHVKPTFFPNQTSRTIATWSASIAAASMIVAVGSLILFTTVEIITNLTETQ